MPHMGQPPIQGSSDPNILSAEVGGVSDIKGRGWHFLSWPSCSPGPVGCEALEGKYSNSHKELHELVAMSWGGIPTWYFSPASLLPASSSPLPLPWDIQQDADCTQYSRGTVSLWDSGRVRIEKKKTRNKAEQARSVLFINRTSSEKRHNWGSQGNDKYSSIAFFIVLRYDHGTG